MRRSRLLALSLALTALTALAAAGGFFLAQATSGGGGDARVAVLKHDDGRVEVGLQTHDGADWGSRQLPAQRFLAANAPTNTWLASSGVPLSAAGDPDLWCVITHGQPDDPYWQLVEHVTLNHWDAYIPDVSIRFESHAASTDQAAALRQCADDGATYAAVTLADPDTMADAIRYAHSQQVTVYSFNSGAADHRRLGTRGHISMDEPAVGARAAAVFAAAGVAGPALCIIHEADNVGLQERCDGFAAAYPGSVTRLSVAETGFDAHGTGQAIAAALSDYPDTAAVFTLNARINELALAAIQHPSVNSSAATVTVGISIPTFDAIENGTVLAAIADDYLGTITQLLNGMYGDAQRGAGFLAANPEFGSTIYNRRFGGAGTQTATAVIHTVLVNRQTLPFARKIIQADPVFSAILQ